MVLAGDDPAGPAGHILIVMNAHHEALGFVLPALGPIHAWRHEIDTWSDDGAGRAEILDAGARTEVGARSLAAFVSVATGGAAAAHDP